MPRNQYQDLTLGEDIGGLLCEHEQTTIQVGGFIFQLYSGNVVAFASNPKELVSVKRSLIRPRYTGRIPFGSLLFENGTMIPLASSGNVLENCVYRNELWLLSKVSNQLWLFLFDKKEIQENDGSWGVTPVDTIKLDLHPDLASGLTHACMSFLVTDSFLVLAATLHDPQLFSVPTFLSVYSLYRVY